MTNGTVLLLGGVVLDSIPVDGQQVTLVPQTLNRHGLIAGATGTGKQNR